MLTILILVAGSAAVLVVLLLIIVVIGIRQEPPMQELDEQAPTIIAAFVRRLLGVYVRKPDSPTLDLGGKAFLSTRDPARRPIDKPSPK